MTFPFSLPFPFFFFHFPSFLHTCKLSHLHLIFLSTACTLTDFSVTSCCGAVPISDRICRYYYKLISCFLKTWNVQKKGAAQSDEDGRYRLYEFVVTANGTVDITINVNEAGEAIVSGFGRSSVECVKESSKKKTHPKSPVWSKMPADVCDYAFYVCTQRDATINIVLPQYPHLNFCPLSPLHARFPFFKYIYIYIYD